MTAGSGSGIPAVAGGLARHVPVLVHRVVEFLGVRDGGVYVDATFGAGGYTRAILAAADAKVIGIDRDASAITRGADLVQEAGGRLVLAQERFSRLDEVAQAHGHALVDADGFAIHGVIQPGTDFYLRPAPGSSATTLTATTPHSLTGRVLTGMAFEDAPQRFTPVALAMATDVAIHFDIDWDGVCEHR